MSIVNDDKLPNLNTSINKAEISFSNKPKSANELQP